MLLSVATHGEGRDSYEDWYYVAEQIVEHKAANYENPALNPLMSELQCVLQMSREQIAKTAENLCEAIIEKVDHKLQIHPSRHDPEAAFVGLSDAIEKHPQTKFRFFTLNHDMLLEKYLNAKEIDHYRGLKPHPKSLAHSRLDLSERAFASARVSVIKLHGSLDWWRTRPKNFSKQPNPQRGEFIGVGPDQPNLFTKMDNVPLLFIGTFNKILRYSTHSFLPLVAAFQASLHKSRRLTVCGYGFADKGINSLLIGWMQSIKKTRMIVVDPKPFDPNRCRFAILDKYEKWEQENRLKRISEEIGEDKMTWTEIVEAANA